MRRTSSSIEEEDDHDEAEGGKLRTSRQRLGKKSILDGQCRDYAPVPNAKPNQTRPDLLPFDVDVMGGSFPPFKATSQSTGRTRAVASGIEIVSPGRKSMGEQSSSDFEKDKRMVGELTGGRIRESEDCVDPKKSRT